MTYLFYNWKLYVLFPFKQTKQNRNRLTDTKNKLMVAKGEGDGEMGEKKLFLLKCLNKLSSMYYFCVLYNPT